MTTSSLAAALRACAAGLYPLEAGVGLLIAHDTFLHRGDFTSRFVFHGTSISDGTTSMAAIDWDAATTALAAGELPCSGGENRILRLAASLAAGIPVDLSDTTTGLDQRNIQLLVSAIRHASGQRQPHEPGTPESDLRHTSGQAIETPPPPQSHVSPSSSPRPEET